MTSALQTFRRWFGSPRPTWACEFTSSHVVVAGVDSSRARVSGRAAVPLPAGALVGSSSARNIVNAEAVEAAAKEALRQAGARGFEICVVIPDDAARIAFLTTENPPAKAAERDAFVRWKLKKSLPFDADTAQMAYRILGPTPGDAKGVDMVVTLSPRTVVQEYEELLEKLGFHAGYVVPSTLAVIGLFDGGPAGGGDALLVKLTPESMTTTVFQNRRPRFYRRVGLGPLYDAVYPTVMYYQDKMNGAALSSAWVCGLAGDEAAQSAELQEKLGVTVRRMEPRNIDDAYKPALGALDFAWAKSI